MRNGGCETDELLIKRKLSNEHMIKPICDSMKGASPHCNSLEHGVEVWWNGKAVFGEKCQHPSVRFQSRPNCLFHKLRWQVPFSNEQTFCRDLAYWSSPRGEQWRGWSEGEEIWQNNFPAIALRWLAGQSVERDNWILTTKHSNRPIKRCTFNFMLLFMKGQDIFGFHWVVKVFF